MISTRRSYMLGQCRHGVSLSCLLFLQKYLTYQRRKCCSKLNHIHADVNATGRAPTHISKDFIFLCSKYLFTSLFISNMLFTCHSYSLPHDYLISVSQRELHKKCTSALPVVVPPKSFRDLDCFRQKWRIVASRAFGN
jgi:hypothetical protein